MTGRTRKLKPYEGRRRDSAVRRTQSGAEIYRAPESRFPSSLVRQGFRVPYNHKSLEVNKSCIRQGAENNLYLKNSAHNTFFKLGLCNLALPLRLFLRGLQIPSR